jgi:hypothetical protein
MDDQPKRPRPKVFDDNYNKYRRSKRHEDRIATALHGRRIPRSGGLAWSEWDKKTAGGDIKSAEYLIEHKRTENASMSIKLDWLVKVREGAAAASKEPALAITFERGTQPPEDWVAVPLSVFQRLTKKDEGDE